MSKHNKLFELSLNDMEVIENALRVAQSQAGDAHTDAKSISEVLGKLHNQKLFYRPNRGVYISG